MIYPVDVHTHTLVSGHAYNTWLENAKIASENGIKVLGTTDHGPKMPGGPHPFYFGNGRVLPKTLFGVTLLFGTEANIIDFEGKLDLPDIVLRKLDIIIASLHDVCIEPGSRDENTEALLKVMENPLVDIIGHSGNKLFPIHEEQVVKKAVEKNVLIEINNGSVLSRQGSEENCLRIAMLCKQYGARIIMGSDAHCSFQIGKFDHALQILQRVNMPEELVMNRDPKTFLAFLKSKNKLQDLLLD